MSPGDPHTETRSSSKIDDLGGGGAVRMGEMRRDTTERGVEGAGESCSELIVLTNDR